MSLKPKDIAKLSKEESLKKLEDLSKGMLEGDVAGQKKKSIKKSVARLKTHIHRLNMASEKKPAVKAEKPQKK
jgi:ribosomal protein L29